MYPTIEVRWFQEGEIPPPVLEAYRRAAPFDVDQPPRVDHYLHIPGRDDMGIKIREGLVEVKHRTHPFGIARFHDRAEGLVEGWMKWSFELANLPLYMEEVGPWANWWVAVRKHRWLRKYRVMDDRRVVAVPLGEICDRGCEWELSEVRIEGIPGMWWSLAFETFGLEEVSKEAFVSVVKKSGFQGLEMPFRLEDSFGYPEWLGDVVSKEELG